MSSSSSSSRPRLPTRSNSSLKSRAPPADAARPDDAAVEDVYRQVESTGSLEAAAKKLQQVAKMRTRMWEDDPEEAEYVAQHQQHHAQYGYGDGDEDENENAVEDDEEDMQEVVHLQEVVEGLWVGDLVAAMDTEGLEERGIRNILSLLRPRLTFSPHFSVLPLEIDDSADTDILTHLPTCVAWIAEALRRREALVHNIENGADMPREKSVERLSETKPAGVLVHCQAGMSRSATVVAAYLMTALNVGAEEAVELIREKRSVIDPSETFWHQLGLFGNANGKVSLRDRSTRQFYMERTASQFMNGDGSAPPMDKMAKYPATPTASNPPTPMGGHGRRKIRCKMCRRHLAVREHMMDHILDQSPISRPRTPSNFALPSPRFSFSAGSNPTGNSGSGSGSGSGGAGAGAGAELSGRRPSIVSDVINPLTGLPGRRSRHDSMSSSGVLSPPPQPDSAMSNGSLQNNDNGSVSKSQARLRSSSDALRITPTTQDKFTSSPMTMSRAESPDTRQLQTADQLASRLPPHLLALRMAGSGMTGLSSPMESSPGSSPERETYASPAHTTFPPSSSSSGSGAAGATGAGAGAGGGAGAGAGANLSRRLSLLAMTPADQPRSRRGSALTAGANANDISGIPDIGGGGGPPILVNPKCSGYFVEPLTWMEPVLKNGDISGKLVCPNEKCGVKIGNFDWAGVQCGCKEWVTPGFCISRSKVDEVW